MSNALEKAIAGLCAEDPAERERAAAEVYAVGRTRALAATEAWRKDEELARLLLGQEMQTTVGLAVERETFGKIRAANGVALMAEVPSDQDAEEFELNFGEEVALDILTSRAPGGSGAIAKYLAKFGEGVQQVEFRCLDVDRATQILRERFGISAVYSETRTGADGTRVNFFLVRMPEDGKILIELYEKK
ncbi:MAG TPA: hypothetical protein VE077_08400 [Candidatus Methylomirabilis sp.]|nr:hypothetical protein [Candidatus Methylomirabilis sp.]